MMVRGFCRCGGVLALAALSAGGVLMMAAQPATGGAPAREGQPGGGGGGGREGGQPGGRGGQGGGEIGVEQGMKMMNGGLKRLKDSIGDAAKKAENLEVIGQIQRGALASKNGKPGHLKGGEAALEGYRKAQIELFRTLLDLESQVLAGETDKAKATFAKLGEMKESGHDKFMEEEKEGGRPPARGTGGAPAGGGEKK